MESRSTDVDVQNQVGPNRVVIVQGERISLISLGAAVRAQASAKGVSGQIEQVEEVVPCKKMLGTSEVLVHSSNVLVGISAGTRVHREVVGFRTVGRQRNIFQFDYGRWTDRGRRYGIGGELGAAAVGCQCSGDAGSAYAQRIENGHIGRKNAGALIRRRNGSGGGGCGTLTITVVAEEEERLVLNHRATHRGAELVLH